VPGPQARSGSAPDGIGRRKTPFKGAFDIIVAFDVLEHIMELETIPENIASKLNPGGYFIFVVPVYDGPTGPIIRKLDHDTTHRHKRSRFFWLAWVSSHFTVCQWQGVFRYLFPFGGYLHVPTKLLRRMAPAIAVVARKKHSELKTAMKRFLIDLSAFLLCVMSVSWAQTFEVISLDGSAKVQRVQKKDMENLSIGSQLHDNDIVESFFQTKCVLRFGKVNIVIIGSNSKILLNIREKRPRRAR